MKNIVFLLSGILIAFSVYVLWFLAENKTITNTATIKIDKPCNKSKKTIIFRSSPNEYTSANKSIKKTVVIPHGTNKQEDLIVDDSNDEEIYKEELKDAGDETIIPIKTKVVVFQKVNITSLIASAVGHGLKMKIKAKEKGGVVKVKTMFTSLMVDKEEAEKKKIKADFITYIVAIVNDKIVFESTTSGFMSENPLLKFSFVGAKKGDELIIVCKVLNGESYIGRKKIK